MARGRDRNKAQPVLPGLEAPVRPSFDLEERLGLGPTGRVAGADEAGRGAWVGPVVAAAVILDPARTADGIPAGIPAGINDSKKLSARRRAALYDEIMGAAEAGAADVGVGAASPAEIDATNILAASFLAMRRAIAALARPPHHVLVDGNQDPGLGLPTSCVVRGDGISLSIAAASIIAKVTRDRIMAEAAQKYPDYGWERNAGYGTAHHRRALELVGITPLHRKSFAPIHKIINQES